MILRYMLVISCLIFLAQPVYSLPFLQNILSSSLPQSHISDFRQRPRSDSRANKTDGSNPPINNYRKTIEDQYTEILGKIIGITKVQLERLFDHIDEQQRKQRLKEFNEQHTLNSEQTVNTDGQKDNNNLKPLEEKAFKKKHFTSLLSAMGLNKLQRSKDPGYISKMLDTADLFINPIFDVWQSVVDKKLQLKSTPYSSAGNKEESNKDTKVAIPPDNKMNPLDDVGKKLKSIFENGFFKYVQQGIRQKSDKNDNEEHLTDIPLDNFPLIMTPQRVDDKAENNNDVEVIEQFGDDMKIAVDNDNDATSVNTQADFESTGIFILEIIGTIAGLTWGAINHMQLLFAGN